MKITTDANELSPNEPDSNDSSNQHFPGGVAVAVIGFLALLFYISIAPSAPKEEQNRVAEQAKALQLEEANEIKAILARLKKLDINKDYEEIIRVGELHRFKHKGFDSLSKCPIDASITTY